MQQHGADYRNGRLLANQAGGVRSKACEIRERGCRRNMLACGRIEKRSVGMHTHPVTRSTVRGCVLPPRVLSGDNVLGIMDVAAYMRPA